MKRLGHGIAGQESQHDHSQDHQGEVFGRPELAGPPRPGGGQEHEADDADGPADERPDGRDAQGRARPPLRAIWYPSRQVTTEAASPGMLTRMEVVEPPYMAP